MHCCQDNCQQVASQLADQASGTSVCFLSGPLSGVLCDRFGCRKVVFVGALIASFGWLVSAFSTGVPYLYFSVGIAGGE